MLSEHGLWGGRLLNGYRRSGFFAGRLGLAPLLSLQQPPECKLVVFILIALLVRFRTKSASSRESLE
jgi:hypothetical protein